MMNWQTTSPRTAALRILEQRFGEPGAHLPDDAGHELLPDAEVAPTWKLADWQAEAVARAEGILRRRGGVLIADSVGLGKTHIGAALIERALTRGLRCTVIVPTALRQQWRRTLRNAVVADINHDRPTTVQILTHAQLSRSFGQAFIADAQFIVVDEAHAFRTRYTHRYQTLHAVRDRAELVLLSATPVNNSSADLLNLLLLFARDDAFRDIGVPALTSAFRSGDTSAIARVLSETTIRRTRAFVRRNYSAIVDRRGHTLRFPEREDPIAIRYDLGRVYGTAWPGALDAVCDLELTWLNVGARELLRLNLLKRFESSTYAFTSSLNSLGDFIDALLRAMRRGRTLSPAEYRQLYNGIGDQLIMDDVLLAEDQRALDVASITRDHDRIRGLTASLSANVDPKLDALRDVLDWAIKDAPAIVFTTYRDTAHQIWRMLCCYFRIALIDGEDAYLGATRASRTSIVRALSPDARVHPRERIEVLVATDVLSEGLDLHAARTVVSYDLPWNPIRLVQRVGRIDRPGSPHDTINILNFIPDQGLDRLLDLMHRIRTKLDTIRSTIGLDAPVLYRTDVDADQLRTILDRLAAGDARVLEDDHDDGPTGSALYHEWTTARGELDGSCGEVNIVASVAGDVSVLTMSGRLFVISDAGVSEDWVAGSQLLLRALADDTVHEAEPERAERAVRDAFRALHALEASMPLDEVAARATRLILGAAPQLAGPSNLVRIETVVRNLRTPLPRSAGPALAQLLSNAPASPYELLDGLETAVGTGLAEPAAAPWIVLLGRGSISVDRGGGIG